MDKKVNVLSVWTVKLSGYLSGNNSMPKTKKMDKAQKMDWEKEFDLMFPPEKTAQFFYYSGHRLAIRDYIRELLSQQRKEILEEVEKKLENLSFEIHENHDGKKFEEWAKGRDFGLNACIEEVFKLTHLGEDKKE